MTAAFMLETENSSPAVIRVIGVGGGGGNAVEHMMASGIGGVEFIAVNTDAQALKRSSAHKVLQIGANATNGLGAGAEPEKGREAAQEDSERLAACLEGADMVFITAGMGGGTGTGASPVIAQLARERRILTVAVVTRPFSFELQRRMNIAQEGIAELSEHVDSLITVPNEKLLEALGDRVTIRAVFSAANDVLHGAVAGVAELITRPGSIHIDFGDVCSVMMKEGRAMMGSGRASGEGAARAAIEAAFRCPLLEDVSLTGARGILVNITASSELDIQDYQSANESVGKFVDRSATVIIGTVLDESLGDEVGVTVIATGLGEFEPPHPAQQQRLRLVGSEPAPAPKKEDSDIRRILRWFLRLQRG